MPWSQFPYTQDARSVESIPLEEIGPRLIAIVDSNPVVNGTIAGQITDGNPRINIRDAVKIRKALRKLLSKVLKSCVLDRRAWSDCEQLIAKEITDHLIFSNYRTYLANANVSNSYDIKKGDLYFLPSYFVFREVKFAERRMLQFFGHRNMDYPEREFYCETKMSERHPNLTISVSSCGNFFEVLVCTSSAFDLRNERLRLTRKGVPFDQYVALDWRIRASRKMLDIASTLPYDFYIDEYELARIESKEQLFF